MPVIRSRELAVALAGLSLALVLSLTAALLAPESNGNLPAGSSLSKATDGSAAAYLTLEAVGYSISRSYEPVASLAVDPASTVLIVADPAEAASNGDRRAVQTLVAAGATIIVTGCLGGSFLAEGVAAPASAGERREFPALHPSPLTAGVPKISIEPRCLRPDLASRYLPLYGSGGSDVVRIARIGSGLAVWWADNTPFAIGPKGRSILWDEFYHGQHRSLYSYAKQTPLPWLGLQLGLVTMAAAFMYVRRRAPVLERPVTPRVSPLEFVDTMGDLYSRVDTAADAVAAARARLRRLAVEATGVTPLAGDERLAKALAARTGSSAAELTQLLADSSAAARPMRPADALSLVRRLQACAAAVARTKG